MKNTTAAIKTIEQMLKPGGQVLIYVPSRNAVFARLNIILPETFKKKLLNTIYPYTKHGAGFPSYYTLCTPRDFESIGIESGLELIEKRIYYFSHYFTFFFPLHILWRLWVILFKGIAGEQAAEGFTMVFQKPVVHPTPKSKVSE